MSATKPSNFYTACRNNDVATVAKLLPKLTLRDINKIESNGSTALHAAAFYGNREIVRMLLTRGAKRMIKNIHGNIPFEEAKTTEVKNLFMRVSEGGAESNNRFTAEKSSTMEWIFIDKDPSVYASFNRKSLLSCRTDEEFNRLCQGIRQYYINENGPLANEKNIDVVREFIDDAIKTNDPKLVIRAYTAETGFYRRVNKDLSQLPTHWSGTKHERNLASIMIFHPALQRLSFTGQTYRGMTMPSEELKKYIVNALFMNKTFQSTSKERDQIEVFTEPLGSSKVVRVVCKYLIKNTGTALDIQTLSEFSHEKEVLILPYATFKVKDIRKVTNNGDIITEIDMEEKSGENDDQQGQSVLENNMSYHKSHSYTSTEETTTITGNIIGNGFEKMFKTSHEKEKSDPSELAKLKTGSFGVKHNKHAYTEKNSFHGKDDTSSFSASNEQGFATSKLFTCGQP
ncbi:unnamed protein product, partial [Rotaria sp. Silwood2]